MPHDAAPSRRTMERTSAGLLLAVGLALGACGGSTQEPRPPGPAHAVYPVPEHTTPPAPGPTVTRPRPIDVLLCDGDTHVTVPPGTAGTSIASALMSEWLRKNPNSTWEAEERERHYLESAADNKNLIGQFEGHQYGLIAAQDVALWQAETERVALAGSEVFHSGEKLGSTIGVSCDMCHPHAANTHPETYPKFQVQLGRVALLRDMINWCIEHPVRGTPFAADDPRMRALEAYILAQRKGKPLEYGKH